LSGLATVEISLGSDDVDLDELVGKKEDMPTGSSGRLHTGSTGRTKTGEDEDDEEDFFDVLEDGTIVEK